SRTVSDSTTRGTFPLTLHDALPISAYRVKGYDFLCLSDHFLDRYDYPMTDTRPYRTESFTTLIGAELHGPDIEGGEKWHILAVEIGRATSELQSRENLVCRLLLEKK